MRTLMRGAVLSPALRERLMLVVTGVNACRYCSYYHSRQALAEGLSREELGTLAAGDFEGSPTEERPALLYAQHWAESDGQPDPAARHRIGELYGTPKAKAIDLALRVIRIGNLTGNAADFLLYVISRGRWGS
jgi:AhpD family alkylhydroperoxidase